MIEGMTEDQETFIKAMRFTRRMIIKTRGESEVYYGEQFHQMCEALDLEPQATIALIEQETRL